jgi:hypothetical protein
MDRIYWQDGWVRPSAEEFSIRLQKVLDQEHWILDGDYRGSLEQRLKRADFCLCLDISTRQAVFRFLRRTFRRHVLGWERDVKYGLPKPRHMIHGISFFLRKVLFFTILQQARLPIELASIPYILLNSEQLKHFLKRVQR